jgi:hypothetical protein
MKKATVGKKTLRLAKETLVSLQGGGQAVTPLTCDLNCWTGSNPLCLEPGCSTGAEE